MSTVGLHRPTHHAPRPRRARSHDGDGSRAVPSRGTTLGVPVEPRPRRARSHGPRREHGVRVSPTLPLSPRKSDFLMDQYAAKQRIMALTWLLDTITYHTVRHLDSGSHARVEVLDARFQVVEDEMRRVQDEAILARARRGRSPAMGDVIDFADAPAVEARQERLAGIRYPAFAGKTSPRTSDSNTSARSRVLRPACCPALKEVDHVPDRATPTKSMSSRTVSTRCSSSTATLARPDSGSLPPRLRVL